MRTTLWNVSFAEHGSGTTLLTVPLFIVLGATWRKATFIHRIRDNMAKCFHCSEWHWDNIAHCFSFNRFGDNMAQSILYPQNGRQHCEMLPLHDMRTTLLTVPLFIILGTTWCKASFIHWLGDNLRIVQGVSFYRLFGQRR
jgi:DTW domain-containing protein YfiP